MHYSIVFTILFLACNLITYSQESDFKELESIHDESNAVLYVDGKRLFFTISNHRENTNGKRDQGDIWYSDLNPYGKWGTPIRLKGPINTVNNDRVLGFSADGKKMYLHGHYEKGDNIVRTQGVSVSTLNNGSWSFPETIDIPYFKNNSNHQSGYINSREDIILISAESYTTEGNEDIYVILKNNNGWSELINLGKDINTRFQEFTPYLSDNEQVLFFSSNGRGGEGSSDIFFSIRKGESWTDWSEPQNMGTQVNTVGKDVNFSVLNYLRKVLYITNTSSNGYGNIKITEPVGEIDTLFSDLPEGIELEDPVSLGYISIKLVNQQGTIIENGKIFSVKGDELSDITYVGEGIFQYPAEEENVIFQAHAPGYIPREVPKRGSENMTIELLKADVGITVNLDNVLFAQGSTKMLPGSERDLNLVVDLLEENPDVKIELSGHTDNRGSASKNLKLSKKRVRAVKRYLMDNGIRRRRISGTGYGGSKPIASNDTEETRKLNRRVEFTIVEN